MAAKRNKQDSNQPELPAADGTPSTPSAPPTPPSPPNGTGPSNLPAPTGNATNGESHIQAESVPEEVIHHPFIPSARELALHKRVDSNFLQYASYVIRDRAIPNIE